MYIRDRLQELRQLAGMEQENGPQAHEIRITIDDSFQKFLNNALEVQNDLASLNKERNAIRVEQEDCLAAGCADTGRSRQLNDHVDQFLRQARGLRTRLRGANEELKDHPESGFGTGRARHERTRCLLATFETIMTQFSEDQTKYKTRAGKKVVAYLQNQNIQVSDDQIDEAIESGNITQLTRTINMGVQQKQALFDDVKNRATDIKIVERQIREVEELFTDLLMLVEQQGETVDRIETSVANATEYAEKARQNVKEAVELDRKSRKWKILIFIVLIILVLVLLTVLKTLSPI